MTEEKESPETEGKPTSFEDVIEKEINDKGLNAPRVTKAEIDALYEKLEYVIGKVSETRICCTAELDGFAIADGFSACVSKENFDVDIGSKIAHRNAALAAYNKLWELEGYRLSRALNDGTKESSIIKPDNKIIV